MLESKVGSTTAPIIDAAASHPMAFVVMLGLMLVFGLGKVARETQASVEVRSFLNLWMAGYLLLLAILMSVTTDMALVLLYGEDNVLKVHFISPAFAPVSAAVLGGFGFEFLVRRFIIGFGENRFDLDKTIQYVQYQAVAATLRREA